MEKLTGGVPNSKFSEMSGLGEGLFTKKEERNCIGLLLFKSDSVMKSLDLQIDNYIQKELETKTGKPINFFAYNLICINEEMAYKLYPEENVKRYLPYIIDNFNSGPSILTLVVANNAPEELSKIKGEVRKRTGIRGNFSFDFNVDEDIIKKWRANEFDPEKTKQMGIDLYGANLIHIPDDRNDTKRTINLLYSKKDISDLILSVPLFARWYKEELKD